MNLATKIAAIGGFAAGIATVIACGQMRKAHASPADCAVWEYASAVTAGADSFAYPDPFSGNMRTGSATVLPAGWEPFAADHSGTLMRRCKQ